MNNKITFPELVGLVAESTSTSERMSELFLKELFATISQALIDGQNVSIKNLGSFEFVASGNESSKKLVFKPDTSLAETINQPFAAFEPIELSEDMTAEMLQSIDNEMEPAQISEDSETSGNFETSETTEIPQAATPLGIMAPPPFVPQHSEPVIEQEPEQESEPVAEPEPEPEPVPEPVAAPEPEPEITNEPDIVTENNTDMEFDEEQRTVQRYMKSEFEQAKHKIAHQSFLKGLITGVLATLALGAIIWGAWSSGRNSVLSSREPVQADTIADQVAADTTPNELQPVEEAPTAAQQPAASGNVVTDTCTATMYLSKMSTKHYGKPDFWIYIYEENKDKIADPNNVTPGTVVVVPPASKYGIDPQDKSSIDRARKRTYDLLSNK